MTSAFARTYAAVEAGRTDPAEVRRVFGFLTEAAGTP
jgi:hypothetical protein